MHVAVKESTIGVHILQEVSVVKHFNSIESPTEGMLHFWKKDRAILLQYIAIASHGPLSPKHTACLTYRCQVAVIPA